MTRSKVLRSMNHNRLLLTCTAAALFAVVAGGAPARGQFDQVFGAQGAPARGAIKKINPHEIVLESSRGEQTFPVNEVRKVSFRDDPSKLSQARDAAILGRYQSALDDLAQLEPDDLKSDATRQDAAYYKAYCLARLALSGNGDVGAAGVELKSFLTQYPESWHYYQANELFGDLAAAAGKFESATEYYRKLSQAPWPDMQMRAAVLEAQALMHQGKHSQALPLLDKVLADASASPQASRQRIIAQTARIKCLAETGKAEEGIKLAEELIANNDSEESELFAAVYNALGACHLKAGRTKDALLAYLHVDILYSNEAEAHAEALYHLGKLWTEVNKSDRAVRSREQLKEKYAGSPWASKP